MLPSPGSGGSSRHFQFLHEDEFQSVVYPLLPELTIAKFLVEPNVELAQVSGEQLESLYITGVLFNPEQERCADAAVLEIRMNDEPTDKARIAVYRPLTEPITLPFSTDLRKMWFPNSSRISWRV